MINEQSDWVSEVSATGLIRHQRQHSHRNLERNVHIFGWSVVVIQPDPWPYVNYLHWQLLLFFRFYATLPVLLKPK